MLGLNQAKVVLQCLDTPMAYIASFGTWFILYRFLPAGMLNYSRSG